MNPYDIGFTKTVKQIYEKMTRSEQARLNKILNQLKENPFHGKPLGYRFLREKKINGKRMYYLIYENRKLVLVVGYSGKKEQQAEINQIKSLLTEYQTQVIQNKSEIILFDTHGHA